LRVKVVDGTSTTLPDTVKNQRAYPQPGGQKPGCGFPLVKLVGVFSLATGVLLDYAKGNPHPHELNLLHRLMDQFKAGDLVLADRGFNSYTLLALLLQRGAHSLFRLHQRRAADLSKGKRLGKNDRWLTWRKPWGWQRPRYLSQAVWKRIPDELSVRGGAFHPGGARISDAIRDAGHDAVGSGGLSRRRTGPPLCAAVANRMLVSRPQDRHGHGSLAL
jgi:hypothetical protein